MNTKEVKHKFELQSKKMELYECNQCNRTFFLHQMLVLHVQRVHRNRKFECDECKARFFCKYDVMTHISTHLKKKPFSCSLCQREFSRQDQLRRHGKKHKNGMRYACQYCSRKFFTIGECEEHEDSEHKKMKPYQCNICDKSFVYKQSLTRHNVLHESNKFKCNYCTEAFHSNKLLTRHLFIHAGARPYPCKICPRTFSQLCHLNRHIKFKHNEISKEYTKKYSDAQPEAQQLTVCSPPTDSKKYKYKIIFSVSYKIPENKI